MMHPLDADARLEDGFPARYISIGTKIQITDALSTTPDDLGSAVDFLGAGKGNVSSCAVK